MTMSGFRGEVLVQSFSFPIHSIYFTSPSAQDREVSQLRETFSPKSPSRMTPGVVVESSQSPPACQVRPGLPSVVCHPRSMHFPGTVYICSQGPFSSA